MFVILAYDINVKRVNLINNICSKYLIWRQNSVFTGRISLKQLKNLEEELKNSIKVLEDYISIFVFPSNVRFKVIEIGIKRYDEAQIIW
ncbi:MAG: CRISPR-associated endonuclease Cas2 [Candidatus Aenigmatarchaeota archaeon]